MKHLETPKLTTDEVFTIIMDTLLDFYNGDLQSTGMRGAYRVAAERIVAKAYPVKTQEQLDFERWSEDDS